MEVRSVVKSKPDYPKMKSISKKEIKAAIPKKWGAVGITALFMQFLMNNKILATIIEPSLMPMEPESGVMLITNPIPKYVNIGCTISILMFIISGISIIITKIKAKKDNAIKVGKKAKIIFITSIILFVLSRIAIFIINML